MRIACYFVLLMFATAFAYFDLINSAGLVTSVEAHGYTTDVVSYGLVLLLIQLALGFTVYSAQLVRRYI